MNKKQQNTFDGRTVDDAVNKGLKAMGWSREETEVDVVDEGSRGFLGLFGGRPAQVILRGKPGALPAQVRAMAGEVLRLMGLPEAQISAQENGGSTVRLSIDSGEDNGLIIGRGGETLRAFEHVLTRMAQRQTSGARNLRVVVSVGGYKSGGGGGDDDDQGGDGGKRRQGGRSGRGKGRGRRRRRRRKS